MPVRDKLTHDPGTKDKIRASQIINVLSNHVTGKKRLKDPSQVTAAVALLRKVMPDLATIEQTIHDPRDAMQPGELVAKLAALFNDKPELWEQVRLLREQSAAANEAGQITIAALVSEA